MRTTITIDADLLAEAKALAARSHRTVSSVLEDALRDLLARGTDPRDQDAIRLPAYGRGGLRPGVDLSDKDQVAELLGDNRLPGGVREP